MVLFMLWLADSTNSIYEDEGEGTKDELWTKSKPKYKDIVLT